MIAPAYEPRGRRTCPGAGVRDELPLVVDTGAGARGHAAIGGERPAGRTQAAVADPCCLSPVDAEFKLPPPATARFREPPEKETPGSLN